MVELLQISFDPSVALKIFTQSLDANDNGQDADEDVGGIVNFIGRVRATHKKCDKTGLDQTLQTLTLQAYGDVTAKGIEQAKSQALARWPLSAAHIIHRVGDMAPSDPIVMVLCAAKHRRDAFLACDYLMDYLKTDAIFWKKETFKRSDGEISTQWIEPRPQDYQDKSRWS